MRIISSFRDYYDVVQGQGQDLDLIYKRETRKLEPPSWRFPELRRRWWRWNMLQPDGLVVGFCGKVYPVIRLRHSTTEPNSLTWTFCFNDHEVRKWAHEHLKKKDFQAYIEPLGKRRSYWRQNGAQLREAIEKFFQEVREKSRDFEEVFAAADAPIFLADSATMTYKEPPYVTVDACLRDLEFYRLFDPYTAYQELAMYMGAKAQPEKPIPEVSDKDMVGAKGFNKWSFRKPPSKRRGKT